MDAINGTSIDRFLNSLCTIAILTNGAGTTEMGLNYKRIGSDMGAITASNTNRFIDPHGLLSQMTTQ